MEKSDILVVNARNQKLSISQRHLAFGELVNRFYDAAYRWAYAVLHEKNQAQDAVQEAFVVAFQNLDQLHEPLAFAGWLRQIVISQAHRQIRHQPIEESSFETEPDMPTHEPGPAAILEEAEMKEKVMTAVQALPEKEQLVTQLFYLNGYSQHEIARLLELPLTTVKKRLQYARQNLKGIMATMVDSFSPTAVPPEPLLAPIPVRKYRKP
jgi:RNA polymerase sigma-70 factor (ECF subfamily)